MQLIKIILHGALKSRFESFAVAGSTPAEALEGWSRQAGLDTLPANERPVVHLLGHKTDESIYAETKLTELHLVPTMLGGGGKGMSIGQIVVGTLMIVAALVIPMGPVLQAALLTAGITMVASGVMGLFQKQPTISKEEDPEASKYIGTGKNTTAIGTLIGMGGGRMMIGGQYLSLQVNSGDMVYGKFPTTPT